ncbi:hypothetical protein, conserved [Trypanosoma brucei brucei TREU927]|uniref:Uncharacterized protein n=1 Tax=Trypanosoma brucei brucei (strain 927/4 GUTat10.1) TaxID=185431 RepID=Q57VH2_TRYB2|nr:hypothetical protein, conserved [Trypanosoma brucei brucei TREU927]XP_844161.1 hypothetical protein, conserved [Trypanosoma brucei brucei TREU927]XP_844163.1 hypothetical protein, conserved [Trypanosoma brucei brucei TREU927]AAX70396.1 hypothetical protein, conserved [Trypanosoma brucei]AAX70397.1 hypothetical protein, conserved [Trypanosoma brucei]AAX70399.1 hypothetical protein, conserved [Trypanosoma brucei]AAZ10601.1 hypothetical protein, conserved [Trypanosoma brucei brucei TREU927]A
MRKQHVIYYVFFCLGAIGSRGETEPITIQKGTECHKALETAFTTPKNCENVSTAISEMPENVSIETFPGAWTVCQFMENEKESTVTQCILKFENAEGNRIACTYETEGGQGNVSCTQEVDAPVAYHPYCEGAEYDYTYHDESHGHGSGGYERRCPEPGPRPAPLNEEAHRCVADVLVAFGGHHECAKLYGTDPALDPEDVIFGEKGDDKPKCTEADRPEVSTLVGEACEVKLRTKPEPDEYLCKVETSNGKRKIKCTPKTPKTIPQQADTVKKPDTTESMQKKADDGGKTEVTPEVKDGQKDEKGGKERQEKQKMENNTGKSNEAATNTKTQASSWKSNNPIIMFLTLSLLLL